MIYCWSRSAATGAPERKANTAATVLGLGSWLRHCTGYESGREHSCREAARRIMPAQMAEPGKPLHAGPSLLRVQIISLQGGSDGRLGISRSYSYRSTSLRRAIASLIGCSLGLAGAVREPPLRYT